MILNEILKSTKYFRNLAMPTIIQCDATIANDIGLSNKLKRMVYNPFLFTNFGEKCCELNSAMKQEIVWQYIIVLKRKQRPI
jgi:hypothetical protein